MPHLKMPASKKVVELCILAAVVLAMALTDATDFKVYYGAAKQWLEWGWTAVYDVNALTPYKYHPLTVFFFVPWTLVPFAVAKILWALLNGFLLFDFRRRLIATFSITSNQILWGCFFLIHALTWQLKFANVTFLMLWLLTWAATSQREWARACGIALLILFKPTWLLLLPLLIFARAYRSFSAVVAVLLIGSLGTWVLGGDSCYSLWWQTLSDPLHAHNYPKNDNQSWFAFCYRWDPHSSGLVLWALGSVLFLAVYLWESRQWRPKQVESLTQNLTQNLTQSTGLLLFTSVLPWLWISPLSWIHHQLLLAPLFIGMALGQPSKFPFKPWEIFCLVGVWLALNGTGELLMGRAGFTAVHQAGVPLLGMILLLPLLPRFYRQLSFVQA